MCTILPILANPKSFPKDKCDAIFTYALGYKLFFYVLNMKKIIKQSLIRPHKRIIKESAIYMNATMLLTF